MSRALCALLIVFGALIGCQGVFGGAIHDIVAFSSEPSQSEIKLHPYQVAVDKASKLACGGALIRKKWVLTAASCVRISTEADSVTVRVGAQFRDVGGERYLVVRIVSHPDFDGKRYANAALLELDDEVVLRSEVAVIPVVPEGRGPVQGDTLLLTGYAEKAVPGRLPELPEVFAARVAAMDLDLCSYLYGLSWLVVKSPSVCAAGADPGICGPEAIGFPLVNMLGQLVGVASYTEGCSALHLPSVFTDLSQPLIRQWMDETAGSV